MQLIENKECFAGLIAQLVESLGTGLLGNPALADKASVKKAGWTGFDYMIDGVVYTKATDDDGWDFSARTPDLGAGVYQAFALTVNASGTIATIAGSSAASAALAVASLKAAVQANGLANVCFVGYVTLAGAQDWDALAALSGTYVNGLPSDWVVVG